MVKKSTYIGLFMVSLATLMYEILLTRIFSVTMWYHFAFMAISIAMFGMTVGAILVYLFPYYFTEQRAKYHLALSSLFFSISSVVCFLVHLVIPFIPRISIVCIFLIAFTYIVISIPFVLSGICMCLALTKFPQHVSKLYAADLAGAALGCIMLIWALDIIGDGPTVVIVIACLASTGALFFAAGVSKKVMHIALACSFLLASFAIANAILVRDQRPLLKLIWVKGERDHQHLYQKWNSFSRIVVDKDLNRKSASPGLSPVCPYHKINQLKMTIDAGAATVITAFNGNLDDLEYLKYDVTNLAHYIRQNSNVLVIGTGGGRDILSALVFKQKSVLGIEINKDIIEAVNKRFGDFSGHLDKNPKVTFVNDEARSYITRLKDKFDIIQMSLIDTWAATAAGAFVLAENSLYTVEAWKIFLEHLNPNGVLSVSRWAFPKLDAELYRLTSLAVASLRQLGIKTPRKHIVIVRRMIGKIKDAPYGLGTILVSKSPFSDNDLNIIEQIANKMKFDVVLTPRFSLDSTFAAISSGKNLIDFPINIAPPTDDSPFFFYVLRIHNILNRSIWKQGIIGIIQMKAVFILATLLAIVIVLTFLSIIVPLIIKTGKASLKGAFTFLIFFSAIGLGFMLIEISQMQRLIIFLGHPIYGLSVVLFSLLLSSSLGSLSTQKISNSSMKSSVIIALTLLLLVLIIFGKLTPYAICMFQGSTISVRVLVAIAILFPLGLLMGMPFPVGIKLASVKAPSIIPWLWGINGATSVCASVLAVVIALASGISTSFWVGFLCYVIAFVTIIWALNIGVVKRK